MHIWGKSEIGNVWIQMGAEGLSVPSLPDNCESSVVS